MDRLDTLETVSDCWQQEGFEGHMAKKANDPVQEQLIAARRSQILDAATTVFAAKGFSRATIKDVAQEAGIADGTIYIYFKNKTALLLGLLDRINESDRREDDLAQAFGMDLHTFMKAYLQQRYDLFSSGGLDVLRAVLPEVLVNPELQEQYMQQIIEPSYEKANKQFTQLIAEGTVRQLDTEIATRVMSATTLGLLLLWIMGDPVIKSRWEELAEVVTEMTLDGILPRE